MQLLSQAQGHYVPFVGGPRCGDTHKVDSSLYVHRGIDDRRHEYILARSLHSLSKYGVVYEHHLAWRPSQ
jgi:hypothetical protein